jgi:hypothetical protein
MLLLKMRFFPILLLLVPLGFLTACGSGATESREDSPGIETGEISYPSIPDSTMQMLWDHSDYVDYIFYQLDFSISQDNQNDIRQSLLHISRSTPRIDPSCRPVGRLFYQVEGENVVDAEIFFGPGCHYYIFFENGEKRYANAMTPAGIQFYERVFTMVNEGN